METKIKKYIYPGSLTPKSDKARIALGNTLAELFDANFDETTGVLYKGTDSTTGFELFYGSGNDAVQIRGKYSGTNGTSLNTTFFAGDTTTLYYIKTNNCLCFTNNIPSGGNIILKYGWVKGFDNSNGIEKWLYFYNTSASNQIKIIGEGGNTEFQFNCSSMQSPNIVSLSPISYETQNSAITSDYFYVATQHLFSSADIGFELDGHEYYMFGTYHNSTNGPSTVLKLT